MVIASGIGGQVGFGEESAYGTYQAPTRFLEFESEGFKTDVRKVRSAGIGMGRFERANLVRTYTAGAAGEIEIPAQNKGLGLLLKHMLGGVATVAAAPKYTHTFTPDAAALLGKYLTTQVGRPDVTGASRPFSFLGGKVKKWSFECAIDEILKFSLDMDFKNVDTAQTLAAATFPSAPALFTFQEGALTYGGSAKSVRSVKLEYDNNLKDDRRFLGNAKKEPLANGIATIEGEMECEFESLADFAALQAGTQAQVILTFTTPELITAGEPFKLIVTLPVVEYIEAEPAIGGPDVLMESIKFKALSNAGAAPISVDYATSDVTP